MEELERWEKPKGRRRKTVCYWKKLMREAGLDPTNAAALTADRKKWRRLVGERMRHLDKYERSLGKKWQGEQVTRNVVRVEGALVCEVCDKVCKSKGGGWWCTGG